MTVTEDILLKNGFNKSYCDVTHCHWYAKFATSKETPEIGYMVEVSDIPNMPDRQWYAHVDNEYRCTVGSVDFNTTSQFNKFMEILDIDLSLRLVGMYAVRKNKTHGNRKLVIYEDEVKLVEVTRYNNWTCYSCDLKTSKHIEARKVVMDNLWWLLGDDCDEDTWKQSVEHWKEQDYFFDDDDAKKAFDSINDK